MRRLLLCPPHQDEQRDDDDEEQDNSWHGVYVSCDDWASSRKSIGFGALLRCFFQLA